MEVSFPAGLRPKPSELNVVRKLADRLQDSLDSWDYHVADRFANSLYGQGRYRRSNAFHGVLSALYALDVFFNPERVSWTPHRAIPESFVQRWPDLFGAPPLYAPGLDNCLSVHDALSRILAAVDHGIETLDVSGLAQDRGQRWLCKGKWRFGRHLFDDNRREGYYQEEYYEELPPEEVTSWCPPLPWKDGNWDDHFVDLGTVSVSLGDSLQTSSGFRWPSLKTPGSACLRCVPLLGALVFLDLILTKGRSWPVTDDVGPRTLIVPTDQPPCDEDAVKKVLEIETLTGTRLKDGENPVWFLDTYQAYCEQAKRHPVVPFADYCRKGFPQQIVALYAFRIVPAEPLEIIGEEKATHDSDQGLGAGVERWKSARNRGRKIDSDFNEDRRIFEAWKTGRYTIKLDLARELQKSEREVKAAIDRHRHRASV
ncbi:MAG: hypothetical protein NTY19_04575 [Planctomycetota bacterium]|nr:hypothetical protein [Planctomycetota bacterium]